MLSSMAPPSLTASLALLAASAFPYAHSALGAAEAARPAARSLLSSRELWATVDVCNPHDQPNTIGIRGSMPGDGSSKDTLYMRFRVQYLDPSSGQWSYVRQGADSGFLKVGPANVIRQAGRSFQFARQSGTPAFSMRGVVVFQWRRGARVLLSTTRMTSAGHRSVAGADPKGYSAATCTLP
jgi:hypothetical protein